MAFPDDRPRAPSRFASGDRVGPCLVGGYLGRGTSGEVYRAELAEDRAYGTRGAAVALKVLHPELVRPASLLPAPHEREALLAAELHHPAIVRAFEAGTCELAYGRVHFLVLELVSGTPLRDLVTERAPLPEVLLRDLALQIARALAAVHAVGAVHRDLKPENVLLVEGRVKLMDLGLAALVDDLSGATSVREFVGSPAYAAPEQFEDRPVVPATDLYALGVVLYEAATGVQPFHAPGFNQVLSRQLRHVPPRARRVNPALSAFFEELLVWLLEKQPARRPPSALAVVAALEQGESSDWWTARKRTELGRQAPGRIQVRRSSPICGRGAELRDLAARMEEVRSEGSRIVVIEGEAGVGKTRLLAELWDEVEHARSEAFLLYGSGRPGSSSGLGPVTEGVAAHLGPAGLLDRLRSALHLRDSVSASFAALVAGSAAPRDAAPWSLDAVGALLLELVDELAAGRPVLWIAEDTHFASPEARAVLRAIARGLPGRRVMLAVTSRRSRDDAEDLDHVGTLEIASRLLLARLPREGVREMLRHRLGEALAAELAPQVADRSDGNPLFVEALLERLRDQRLLDWTPEGGARLRGDVAAIAVPSTVRGILLSRLGGLGDEDRSLLDAAAVQGFEFEADLLEHTVGRPRLEVLQGLARLERRAGIVRSGPAGFQFDHHQLQEVVYDSTPAVLRAEYHARLAQALEARAGFVPDAPGSEVPRPLAALLAEHWLKGGQVARGLRHVFPALDEHEWRNRRGAAIELAERALAALGPDDGELRARLLLREVALRAHVGADPTMEPVIERALAAARACGDTALDAEVRFQQGFWLRHSSRFDEAVAVMRAVEVAARALGDRELGARAAVEIGTTYINRGLIDDGRRHVERALEIDGALLTAAARAHAHAMLGMALMYGGSYGEARVHLERGFELDTTAGNRAGMRRGLHNLSHLCLNEGRYDEAVELLERAQESADEDGDRRGQAIGFANLGAVWVSRGKLGQGRACIARQLALCRSLGFRHNEVNGIVNLGFVALLEGAHEEAEQRFEECLALSRKVGTHRIESYAELGLGRLALLKGDLAIARERLEEALARLRRASANDALAELCVALAGVHLAAGERAAALPLLDEAERIVAQTSRADPGPLPAAYLALLGARDARDVIVPDRSAAAVRAEAHLVLHRAGDRRDHLARARTILSELHGHLAGEALDAFWSRSLLGRMLREIESEDALSGRAEDRRAPGSGRGKGRRAR